VERLGVVSAAMKAAFAAAVLLGAATLAASEDRTAAPHPSGRAEVRGTRTIPASKNSSRSNELATRPTPSDVGGRPAYAPPNECWTDDGGFRWRPCTAGGGGGM
jgi:ribosomal protein L4